MAEKVFMIALSPTMEEGTILSWKKKVGDQVKMDEPLCEVETDKASMEYLSSQEGTLLAIVKDVGTSARVADLIAVIGEPGEDFSALLALQSVPSLPKDAPVKVPDTGVAPSTASIPAPAGGRVKSSPLARKLAATKGIEIAQVAGSGPDGPVGAIRGMLELLWKSQVDRHGTPDATAPLSVTQGQAEAAFHLALTLVQFFTAGVIRSAT